MKNRKKKLTCTFKVLLSRKWINLSPFGGIDVRQVQFAEVCPACGEWHDEIQTVFEERDGFLKTDNFVFCPIKKEKIYLRWAN